MRIDAGPVLDLFDVDYMGLLSRLAGLLLFLVLELAPVENLHDRRIGARSDLDEVKTGVFRPLAGVFERHDAGLGTVLVDQQDGALANSSVDPGPVWWTNGTCTFSYWSTPFFRWWVVARATRASPLPGPDEPVAVEETTWGAVKDTYKFKD